MRESIIIPDFTVRVTPKESILVQETIISLGGRWNIYERVTECIPWPNLRYVTNSLWRVGFEKPTITFQELMKILNPEALEDSLEEQEIDDIIETFENFRLL